MLEPVLNDNFSEQRIYQKRITLAFLIVLLLLTMLVARYTHLQVNEFRQYTTQSERNRVHVESIAPKRGLIFDINGVLVAGNRASYNLTIVKERTSDLELTLASLAGLLDIKKTEIEKFKMRLKSYRPFEAIPLRFKLSEREIALIAVNSFRLPGVDVTAQLVRSYPLGPLLDHTVGYVGRINEKEQQSLNAVNYAGTHHIGKVGLEKYYEHHLHGVVGYQNIETNARGKVLRILERTDPVPGNDIGLYLDTQVQQVAHKMLGEQRGSVVAIDVKSGGIIAMVSTPGFDPNLFVNGISQKEYSVLRDSKDLPLFNRSLQGQYPPGSTIKPIIGLAGLEAKVITSTTHVYDPGWFQLPNDDTERHYRDWKKTGHGRKVNLHQAITESCDTYFYNLAHNLGINRIHDFSQQFGLGKILGIDSTSERPGLLPSKQWKKTNRQMVWFPGETLSAGIGQGYMLVTPLQLAVATATIAGRGKRIQPRLLKTVNGIEMPMINMETVLLSDEKNWDIIFSAMKSVVHSTKGTAKRISKGAKFKIAGKTGTAQVIGIKQDEEYDAKLIAKRNLDHALFIGFAPYEDPQIAVAVVVENGEHGSSTAAPIARKVMDRYLLRDTKVPSVTHANLRAEAFTSI